MFSYGNTGTVVVHMLIVAGEYKQHMFKIALDCEKVLHFMDR